MTTKNAVDLFLLFKSTNKPVGTVNRYKTCLYKLVDIYGEKSIGELSEEDIFRFIHLIKGKYKDGYVFNILTVLKLFIRYNYPKRTEIHPDNIQPERPDHVVPYTDPEDIEYLCEFCDERTFTGVRNILIMRMLQSTGLRVSELLSMTLGHLKPVDEQQSYGIKCEALIVSKKKRKHEERPIRWSKDVHEYLLKYLALRVSKDYKSESLFLGKTGTPLTVRSVERVFEVLCKVSSLEKKITPHSLRHGFGHTMARNGATGKEIGDMLGHSPFNATSGLHYLRFDTSEKFEIWRKFVK